MSTYVNLAGLLNAKEKVMTVCYTMKRNFCKIREKVNVVQY